MKPPVDSMGEDLRQLLVSHVNVERLVETACSLVDIPSPTGSEQAVAERVREICEEMGLAVSFQEVEAGRSNVLATLVGGGGGRTLMFNGHTDTSYSALPI